VFRLILNVILHMEYGAVRVKWHHFWIQHMLIYLKTLLALVWSTVIDTIYLFLIFNQEILLQNNRVYMKFWDTQIRFLGWISMRLNFHEMKQAAQLVFDWHCYLKFFSAQFQKKSLLNLISRIVSIYCSFVDNSSR